MILMDLSLPAAVSTWHPPNLHRPHLDSSSPNQSFQTSTFHNKKNTKGHAKSVHLQLILKS